MAKNNNRFITTPYRYSFSVTLLIIICLMLSLGGIYFHSYAMMEEQSKQRLLQEKKALQLAPDTLAALFPMDSSVFLLSIKKPIPQELKPALQRGVIKLSAKEIKHISAYTVGNGVLATLVSSPRGEQLLAATVNHRGFLFLLLRNIIYLFVAIFVIMLIYSFIISSRMARRIAVIDTAAKAIMDGNLQKRIPIRLAQPDEYTQLSMTLNSMLERIQTLMQDLRQVNNNVAHDLKTPLNRMRSRLEITLLHPQNKTEYQAILAATIEDIDELLKTFDALLLLGNLSSNARSYHLQNQDASVLLNDLGELYQALAEEKQQCIQMDIADNISVNINKRLFSQAMSNLLDNAIKYTPKGGEIYLSLQRHNQQIRITVADNGIGIAAGERSKVLEAFTRLDQSRQQPGTGLGLALVKAIVQMHRGTIELQDNCPGLRVCVCLPLP